MINYRNERVMNTSDVQYTDGKRAEPQALSLLGRTVMAIGLAAMLVAWTPVTASLAMTSEGISSNCGGSLYWEYFLAHTPDSPQVAQQDCLLADGEVGRPGNGASLYWEYFLAHNSDTPQLAQIPLVPVTGEVGRPGNGASLYWEYFLAHNP